MIIKKHNSIFIANVSSKKASDLLPIFEEYCSFDIATTKGIITDLKNDSNINLNILFINKSVGRLQWITLDSAYIDTKCYSNGHSKINRECRIMLENFIDGLNEFDCDIIARLMRLSGNKVLFNSIYKLYNKTPKKCSELYDYTYKHIGFNSNDSSVNKTHLYTTIKYDGVFPISRNYEECKYVFPLCEIVYCEETDKSFLIIQNNNPIYQLAIKYNGEWMCEDFYNENYYGCNRCDDVYYIDDLYYLDDEDDVEEGHYCEDCQSTLINNRYSGEIHSYSYKPRAKFFYYDNKKKQVINSPTPITDLNIGFELEIEARNSDVYLNESASEINQLHNGLMYCKSDCSIDGENGGFEIVSHPITFNAIKNLDLENTLFKYNKDFKSFYTRNCGMHIHLSRKAFNDMQMYKFILMMNSYKTLVHLVSQRRRISEYNSWCNFSDSIKDRVKSQASFNFKQQKENIKYNKENTPSRKIKLKFQSDVRVGERYQVVNLQNPQTIEIRSFKGTLKYSGFMKNIEFVHSMFYFCKNSSLQDLNVKSYIDYVNSDLKTYKHLNNFFNENKQSLKYIIENPNEDLQ